MRTTITHEQLDALIRYAEDERSFPGVEAIEALNLLHETVQRSSLRLLGGQIRKNAILSERLDKYKEREQRRVDTGEFPGTGLTSVEVARALLYQLQKNAAQRISVGKIILLLYKMYATWLYSARERLFGEYPTANSFGAQFNDVYAHFKNKDLYERVPYAEWRALCDKNYSVAGVIESYAAKYAAIPYKDIQDSILKSTPWLNASRENNDGKWGKIISDQDIYNWKKKLKEKKQA